MLNAVLTSGSSTPTNTPKTPEEWMVVVLGIGIVFVGLICIIILCTITGKIIPALEKLGKEKAEAPAPAAPVAAPAAAPVAEAIPNRQELVAAISCALAEEMGTEVSAIRIVSLKKI